MTRGVFLLEPDEFGVLTVIRVEALIALARCERCGSRTRVLPSDILPRKLYSLAVIEFQLAAYTEGGLSLRVVAVRLYGERTPAHTTIYVWSEGMGAHLLGRAAGELAEADPHTALVQETEARCPAARDVPVPAVDARRYRAKARRERLSAVARLLVVAGLATGVSSPCALASWCALALGWGLTSPILFRTGLSNTRPEQVGRPSRARSPPK